MKIFWSYAKRDDANPQHVTQLRKQFEIVLGQCIGDDIDLFQDTSGLKWGVNWRSALESEVKSSNVFVFFLLHTSIVKCVFKKLFGRLKQELVYILFCTEHARRV